MEALIIILKVVGIFIYLVLGVGFWVTWMGMHNNTIDGNSFRLMYPFIVFDKTQFTDRGNYWRSRHLLLYVVGIVLSIGYWVFLE